MILSDTLPRKSVVTCALPRVLMAIDLDPSREFGSLEEQVVSLAREFQKRASVLLPVYRRRLGADAAAIYRAAGLRALALDLRRFNPFTLARLLALVRREHIDVIHWNFYTPLTNAYVWTLSTLVPRVKHIYTDHISRPTDDLPPATPLKSAVERRMVRHYAEVVCVSDFVRSHLAAQGTWGSLRHCHSFVNTDRFAPDRSARARLRAERNDDDRFVALVVARLVPEKGVDVAIRALALLPAKVVLWVVGDGPEAGRLQALGHELGVADRLRFLGVQRHVESFMQAADCLVCPSLCAEPAGLVSIEALASGLPVIASAVGGIPEIVEEELTGFLVPPGDAVTLAYRLQFLIDDPRARLDMARNARAEALDLYSTEVVVPDYVDFYHKLLHPSRSLHRTSY